MDDKSFKFIFIGYNSKSKAYKLFDPYNSKVVVSRDVEFNEGAGDWHNKVGEIQEEEHVYMEL